MKRLIVATILIATLVSSRGSERAIAQTLRPVPHYLARTAGLPLSGPYDLVHFMFDFEPGASTPWHTHAGLVLISVVEGEITFRMGGVEKVYNVGDIWTEMPD